MSGRVAVAGLLLALCGGAAAQPVPDERLGLPAMAAPAAPRAVVELGRKLFFDRRLSRNGTLSCAMCHVPAQAFTQNELRTSVGMEGRSLRRNAPTLLNVAQLPALFHDGRAASLEAQALQPLLAHDEMDNGSEAALERRVAALADYRRPAARAFGRPVLDAARIGRALAAYERTLLAAGSPFDRWRHGGDAQALTPLAQRGFALFVARGCSACHRIGPDDAMFSDGQYHDTGVRARSEALARGTTGVLLVPGLQAALTPAQRQRIGEPDAPDRGRAEVSGAAGDERAFRTPSLRNVARTAPYMHDGSLATLSEVLDHYARGGWPADPGQDPRLQPFALPDDERAALLAFLEALTSPAVDRLAAAGTR